METASAMKAPLWPVGKARTAPFPTFVLDAIQGEEVVHVKPPDVPLVVLISL